MYVYMYMKLWLENWSLLSGDLYICLLLLLFKIIALNYKKGSVSGSVSVILAKPRILMCSLTWICTNRRVCFGPVCWNFQHSFRFEGSVCMVQRPSLPYVTTFSPNRVPEMMCTMKHGMHLNPKAVLRRVSTYQCLAIYIMQIWINFPSHTGH